MFRGILCFLLLLSMPVAWGQETQKEYIIVTGGPSLMMWEKFKMHPHDNWWGNFVRASRVRIEQLRKQFGPQAQITWMVYKPSYVRRMEVHQDNEDLLANIQSVRDKYHLKLIFFNNASQVIDYLNAGQPRDSVKIADWEYFGHSNSRCFMFDYSNEIDSASKNWLHETDLARIHRDLFTQDPFIKSWGCYTGESMSTYWWRATGKKMIGAIGKTDYADGDLHGWIPQLAPGGHWGG